MPQRIENPRLLRAGTAAVTLVALALALISQQSVFNLVIMAWSGLVSAFAPLLIVLALGGRHGSRESVVAVLIGLIVAMPWRYAGWQSAVYEGMPGIIAGVLVLAPAPWLGRLDAVVQT